MLFWDQEVPRMRSPKKRMEAIMPMGRCSYQRFDKLTVGQVRSASYRDDSFVRKSFDSDEFDAYMLKVFSAKQLGLIECAFEMSSGFDCESSDDEIDRAVNFGCKHR
jgi:hypothetical protein